MVAGYGYSSNLSKTLILLLVILPLLQNMDKKAKIIKTISLHTLFWALIWCVPLVLLPIIKQDTNDDDDEIAQIICMTGVFYFNFQYLYPRFFAKKKLVTFLLLAIATTLVASIIINIVNLLTRNLYGPFYIHVIIEMFMGIAFIAVSTLSRVIDDSIREKRLQRQRETENLRTELSFLRSQVSPHFMFNVLNSIVALIRQRSDKLETTVIELSYLMRYMLYESDEKKVNLRTEIQYFKSYIDLQMLRFGAKTEIQLEIPDKIPDNIIEPMLLIPLIENAFKHGTNVIDKPFIFIDLSFTNGDIYLHVMNKCRDKPVSSRSNNSGIGLVNLERRLNLLYPGSHELLIKKENGHFEVFLNITLHHEMRSH